MRSGLGRKLTSRKHSGKRAARWLLALVALVIGGAGLAGCHRLTVVEGVAWLDADLDGVRDAGESPAAGVTVTVNCHYTDPQVFTDGECDSGTTDAEGRYELFVRVDPRGETQGIVGFDPPDGFDAIEPPDVNWFFTFPHREQRDLAGIDAAIVDTGVGSIGDRVWQDDGDGIQEDGEPGVAGIPVELQVGVGEVVASTVTDADGRYLFEAVPAGRSTVRFGPLPPGLRFAPDRRGIDAEDSDANPYSGRAETRIEGGQVFLDVDAGVVTAQPGELGQIGDLVWSDLDGDGVQDPGEPGEAGVEVLLVGANTGQLAFTVTDAEGRHEFLVSRAIAPDQPYRLVFAPPPGVFLTAQDAGGDDALDSDADRFNGSTADFTLDPDEIDTTRDAGLDTSPRPAAVGDFVWDDADGDGLQDQGERGIAGVSVDLLDASGAVVASTTTSAIGTYVFDGITPGDYRVSFVAPVGLQFSPANQGADDRDDSDPDPATGETPLLSLSSGVDVSVDAGLRSAPPGGSTIGDFVWRDVDRDGIQESNEPGMLQVTVRLLDASDTEVATFVTDASGFYRFENVAPGSYRVRFVTPPSFQPTVANAGADDAVDSDINGGGESPVITVVDGQVDLTIDAGFTILA
jgi:protocatechuate 3,4-dioxygenase beta subunit